jgi:hypothetical protein
MLEKNLQHIEKYNPKLAQNIRNHKIAGNYTFALSESGDVNLIYEDVPFHSVANPQEEAQKVFSMLSDTSRKAINVIFGIGLGYLFKRVYISSESRILLFEPNIDLLRITFENVDFSEELADNRVMLANQKEDLNMAFKKFYLYEDPINMCFLDIYKLIYPDMIKDIQNELMFLKGIYNNNYFTLFEVSDKWLKMSIKNINNVLKSHYIDILKDKFSDIPAIIISPGPSLKKNIEQVKKYSDNAVIFCIGGAVRLVKEQNKIHPDFSVYIDVNKAIEKQLDDVNNIDKLNFITQPSVNKAIYNQNSKRNFVYLPCNDHFSNWLAAKLKLNNKHYINRGTVAVSALYAAINFGCNPIIMVGQDLAYNKEGNVYADDKLFNPHKKAQQLIVPGWHGEKVTTNTDYAIFRRYYEEIASEYKDKVRIINATEGGAYIEGLEHIPFLEAALLIPDKKIDVEAIIQEAEQNSINPLRAGKMTVANALKDNYNTLDKILPSINKAQKIKEKLLEELDKYDFNKNYILKKFQELYELNGKIDRIINESCQLMSPMIQKESYAFRQEFGRNISINGLEDINRYLELCQDYYDKLSESIPVLKEFLEIPLKGSEK